MYRCNNKDCGVQFTHPLQTGKFGAPLTSITMVCPKCFHDNWVKLVALPDEFICKCGNTFLSPLTIGNEESEAEVSPCCKSDNFMRLDVLNLSEETLNELSEGVKNATDDFKVMAHSMNDDAFPHLYHQDSQLEKLTSFAHRYRVSISYFILCDTDEQAQEIAQEHVKIHNSEYDSQCTLDALDRVDFGSREHIKII